MGAIASQVFRNGLSQRILSLGGAPVAKTVLIVDDNEFLRQALCDLFQRQADFEVCADAENGREAIEMAEQLPQEESSLGNHHRDDRRRRQGSGR